MTIGVDSSLIVAALHANHPRHAAAADWMVRNIGKHRLVVAQHTILETYAVLTRLPGDLRVTPSEARDLLAASVRPHMAVAGLQNDGIWGLVDRLVESSVIGGRTYDAYIVQALRSAGVEAVATMNRGHFAELAPELHILDPSLPGA
jgi:predicted nucleic acid-binding protein